MHHQVEEIVTKYGKLDILWFDFFLRRNVLVRNGRQAILNRNFVRKTSTWMWLLTTALETSGEGFGSIASEEIRLYSGDFVSPEQIVPHEGIRNVKGELLPWELCLTMNNHWAYNPSDKHL